MKKVKLVTALFVAGLFLLVLNGCKKYDEGGTHRKAETRLTANNWKLDKYLRNGNDETSQMIISNYIENFVENGTITRQYIDEEGEIDKDDGSWEFDEEGKDKVEVSGLSSTEFTNQSGNVKPSSYIILKLKNDELWYYYDDGGNRHEFHFIKQ